MRPRLQAVLPTNRGREARAPLHPRVRYTLNRPPAHELGLAAHAIEDCGELDECADTRVRAHVAQVLVPDDGLRDVLRLLCRGAERAQEIE